MRVMQKNQSEKDAWWLSQLSIYPTLGLGSAHDLIVRDGAPHLGSAPIARSLLGILSPSLSASPLLTLYLSLKINKY